MSRKRSFKPRPRPGRAIVITKELAATRQLETAIRLWFAHGDPISMLILSYNAHEIINAMGKTIGKPSEIESWLKELPPSFQERWKYVNNFCKHAWKDLNEDTPYDPRQAEILMYFASRCYRGVFGTNTALMLAFGFRFLLENPDLAAAESDKVLCKLRMVGDPRKVSRQQFLQDNFAFFSAVAARERPRAGKA